MGHQCGACGVFVGNRPSRFCDSCDKVLEKSGYYELLNACIQARMSLQEVTEQGQTWKCHRNRLKGCELAIAKAKGLPIENG